MHIYAVSHAFQEMGNVNPQLLIVKLSVSENQMPKSHIFYINYKKEVGLSIYYKIINFFLEHANVSINGIIYISS